MECNGEWIDVEVGVDRMVVVKVEVWGEVIPVLVKDWDLGLHLVVEMVMKEYVESRRLGVE